MSKRASAPPVPPDGDAAAPAGISRRQVLQQLGLGLGALAVGCGAEEPPGGPDGGGPDGGGPDGPGEEPEPMLSKEELLRSVDTIVVLMMENRSFDHYLGPLRTDALYPRMGVLDGLTGMETNPDPFGT